MLMPSLGASQNLGLQAAGRAGGGGSAPAPRPPISISGLLQRQQSGKDRGLPWRARDQRVVCGSTCSRVMSELPLGASGLVVLTRCHWAVLHRVCQPWGLPAQEVTSCRAHRTPATLPALTARSREAVVDCPFPLSAALQQCHQIKRFSGFLGLETAFLASGAPAPWTSGRLSDQVQSREAGPQSEGP